MRRLRKFFRLSTSDRNLSAIAFIVLGAIRLGLWLIPFRNLLKLLPKISQLYFLKRSQTDPGKIVWAVNMATRHMPFGAKCLARALTTQVLMNSQCYSAELRIGVAKAEGGKLEAHAWVEYEGQVAIGNLSDLSRYIPLPSHHKNMAHPRI